MLVTVESPQQSPHSVWVSDSCVFGRDPTCDVAVDDPKVSARHALLNIEPIGAWLSDLHSNVGTFVGNDRVEDEVWLTPPAEFRIGSTVVKLLAGTTALVPSHRRRVEAFAIDVLVFAVVFGLAVTLDKLAGLPTAGLAVVAVAVWVYYVGATAWLMGGQSAGKVISGLQVRRVKARSGTTIPTVAGLLWSVGRQTIGYVIVDVFLLGSLLTLVSRSRRCLHDFAFASEVVQPAAEQGVQGTLIQRFRSYWEIFYGRYDELSKRYRWIFFPWTWLTKVAIMVALVIDKLLPTKADSATEPVKAAKPLSAKAMVAIWTAATASTAVAATVVATTVDPDTGAQISASGGHPGEPGSGIVTLAGEWAYDSATEPARSDLPPYHIVQENGGYRIGQDMIIDGEKCGEWSQTLQPVPHETGPDATEAASLQSFNASDVEGDMDHCVEIVNELIGANDLLLVIPIERLTYDTEFDQIEYFHVEPHPDDPESWDTGPFYLHRLQ